VIFGHILTVRHFYGSMRGPYAGYGMGNCWMHKGYFGHKAERKRFRHGCTFQKPWWSEEPNKPASELQNKK
jgi:hypothetical protein